MIKKQKKQNREYRLVSFFFVIIFLSLIGYVIYFDGAKSQDFINSPYNTRQDTFSDRVIRGQIESSDGQVLARTVVDEDGSEYREYPYSRMFSHVVGYDTNGKSGIESEANFQLLSSHTFFINQLKNQFRGRKSQGDTVVSTLDSVIQSTAYYALGDRNGAIIAIQPSTGKILAMVSKPDFDPNTIGADWDYYVNNSESSNLLNRATNGQYPPGSTFKIVTALDYLREKGTLNNYTFQCQGTITREEHTIRCYNSNVHGMEDFYTAFSNSCNTAFASIGVDLGGESLRKTSEELLFNQKLPFASSKRSVFSLDKSSPVPLLMQTAIGQGNTLVSPLHMALITCSIANHGVMMKPYLVDSVKNVEGQLIKTRKPEAYKRIMSNNEANLLGKLMTNVVTNGTASSLSGKSYTAAGKTGSAEFNETGSSHSWFVGYCNVNEPDLVVAVIVENGGTGSEAAVPIAAQLFDAYYTSQTSHLEAEDYVDYSTYENEDESESGWFDIVEEDSMIYDTENDDWYDEENWYEEDSSGDNDNWEEETEFPDIGEIIYPEDTSEPDIMGPEDSEQEYYEPDIPEVGDPNSGVEIPEDYQESEEEYFYEYPEEESGDLYSYNPEE